MEPKAIALVILSGRADSIRYDLIPLPLLSDLLNFFTVFCFWTDSIIVTLQIWELSIKAIRPSKSCLFGPDVSHRYWRIWFEWDGYNWCPRVGRRTVGDDSRVSNCVIWWTEVIYRRGRPPNCWCLIVYFKRRISMWDFWIRWHRWIRIVFFSI